MTTKRVTERNIKSMVRRCFREINKNKEYAFVLLLFIFTCIVFYQPTFEKVIIYIVSLIAIHFIVVRDEERKIRIKLAKNNVEQ